MLQMRFRCKRKNERLEVVRWERERDRQVMKDIWRNEKAKTNWVGSKKNSRLGKKQCAYKVEENGRWGYGKNDEIKSSFQ